MVGQYRDIFRNIAKRWRLDMNYLQAVVQIFAKRTFFDGGFQVLVRCGDHSNIDWYGAFAADSVHRAFLQDAQDLGLSGETQVADLVQK